MEPPFLRTEFNYDMDAASKESGLHCKDPSLTQQQFAEECDINTIVERFHLTGEMPQLTGENVPSYQNYEGIFDYQTAMNAVRRAEETFMELPAKTRARFNNEPQQFLEFCENKDNYDEAERLGFLDPSLVAQRREMKAAAEAAAAPQQNQEKGAPEAPKTTQPEPAKSRK